MDYIKKRFKDENENYVSFPSTDDNVLCNDGKTLREKLNSDNITYISPNSLDEFVELTKEGGLFYSLTTIPLSYNNTTYNVVGLIDSRPHSNGYNYFAFHKMWQFLINPDTKALVSFSSFAEFLQKKIPSDASKLSIKDTNNNFTSETVEGALSELSSQYKDKANKYCVNVCDFGCVGDGITDDTDNLQSAIDYAISNNLNIISPKNKVYAISRPISLLNSNNILHLDFNKSTIKAISNIDYVLSYNCVDGTNDGGTIQNLYIDANEKANDCIRFEYTRKTRVYNCVLKNAKEKYVNVVNGNIIVYGLYLDKRLYNYPNTIGIYISPTSSDSKINSVYMRDVKKAVVCEGGSCFFHQVHAYMLKSDLISGSIFMTLSQNVNISDCYSDTYNIGFKIIKGFVQINNSHLWINTEFYNNTTCTDVPKVFDFADADRLTALLLNNNYIRFYEYYQSTGKYGEFSNLDGNTLYYKSLVDLQKNNYFNYCAKLPICSFRSFTLNNITSSSYTVYQNDVNVDGFNITLSIDFKYKTNFSPSVEFSLGSLPINAKHGTYSFLGTLYSSTDDSVSYVQPIKITSSETVNSIMKFKAVNNNCDSLKFCVTIPLRIVDTEENILSYNKRKINN